MWFLEADGEDEPHPSPAPFGEQGWHEIEFLEREISKKRRRRTAWELEFSAENLPRPGVNGNEMPET